MEPRQGIFERLDRALRVGTRRVHRVSALVLALLGLTAAATLLWSAVTGVTQKRIALQLPGGPALVISDLSGGPAAGEEGADDSGSASALELTGEDEAGSALPVGPAVTPLEPISSQQIASLVAPITAGAGGMCFFGEWGAVEIYPAARRRKGGRRRGAP